MPGNEIQSFAARAQEGGQFFTRQRLIFDHPAKFSPPLPPAFNRAFLLSSFFSAKILPHPPTRNFGQSPALLASVCGTKSKK
jgi:hypothetical protein